MTIPPTLQGAWRRTGLIIGGKRQIDYCDVLWIQGVDWYADIRLRITDLGPDESDPIAWHYARVRAFAGIARWEDPILSWDHAIDVTVHPPLDANEITWSRGGILESGIRQREGQDVPWTEEWTRISRPDAVVTTRNDSSQHLNISVEDWAIDIRDDRPSGQFVAARHDWVDGSWLQVGQVLYG